MLPLSVLVIRFVQCDVISDCMKSGTQGRVSLHMAASIIVVVELG